jgi:hypothetical protein
MRYLAQLDRNSGSVAHLKLLAQEKSAYTWHVLTSQQVVDLGEIPEGIGSLVLAELSGKEVVNLEDATHWLLALVESYLSQGITPEFLQEEAKRAEQWRQELTLQSQDLARRSLELEARLRQIQELEERLNGEKDET